MQSAALRLQQSMAITREGTTSKRSLEKELAIMVIGKENVLRCHEKGKAVVEPAELWNDPSALLHALKISAEAV